MNDYETIHKFQGKTFWIEILQKRDEIKIVIGTFDGQNMFVSNVDDARLRMVVSILALLPNDDLKDDR
jgi:hypothetical protein